MADNNKTVFQRLNNLIIGSSNSIPKELVGSRGIQAPNDQVLFSTSNKEEYEKKLLQLKQQKLLSHQWILSGVESAVESLPALNAIRIMYRDCDLMDGTPEIGTALDIIGQESCPLNSKGKMINIYSKSARVKSILEDLFVNRLNIHTELPPIARKMAKYGNVYRLLNINGRDGVMGWRELPVYEIDRIENGFGNGYVAGGATITGADEMKPDEVRFVWNGHNETMPFRNWQVAHFRLLNDTFFLPYGTSALHKARRAWRMWSMMEDAMLIYRLDKSIERRVYKIYVGAIDDADVPAYVQEVANNFKRTPIIDPLTGQIDLRKNFMDVSTDYFIPVRSENAPNPIESLAGATWQNQMEDIEYMQNKILTALQIPKTYLNFQEAQGKGENLSIKDIRFARMINRIQQFLIAELNKIAMIHLYLIGMTDDLSNFTITLNNPTNQIEQQELDDLTKRITVAAQALADPGIGMPIFSLHKVLKEIMKMTDSEIKDMLNEIRVEKAMAAELEQTSTIIKHTGVFDQADRIYGDYEAMNSAQAQQQPVSGEEGPGGLGGPGPGGPGPMPMPDSMGEEGDTDMGGAADADSGVPMENRRNRGNLITERAKSFTSQYFDMLMKEEREAEDNIKKAYDYDALAVSLNERVSKILNSVEDIMKESDSDETPDETSDEETNDFFLQSTNDSL